MEKKTAGEGGERLPNICSLRRKTEIEKVSKVIRDGEKSLSCLISLKNIKQGPDFFFFGNKRKSALNDDDFYYCCSY